MIKKICNACKEKKDINDFHKGNGKYGKRTQCAKCCNIKYNTPERQEKRNEGRRIARQSPEYRKQEGINNIKYRKNNFNKYLFRLAKSRAKGKNIDFTITLEDVIIPKICPLLGIKLYKENTPQTKDSSPSLDRKNNNLGYVPNNVWVISYRANKLKNNATTKELAILVKNLKKNKIN